MKMKRIFSFLTLAIVMVAMFDACSTEEGLSGSSAKQQLSISVQDGQFKVQDGTRTMPSGDDGLGTKFAINDKIGIFGVDKDGSIILSNECYTFDGHLWNSTKTIAYDKDATYFAYYPWNSDADIKKLFTDAEGNCSIADVKGAVTASATTEAVLFFAPLIEKWNPLTDQSTLEAYNASDLMVGKGETTKDDDQYTMHFTMDHQMGLCLTSLKEVTFVVDANYKFTLMPNYKITSEVKPCYYMNKYRYIVKPGQERDFVVKNADETYTIPYYVKERAHYIEHIVGDCERPYQVKLGDIYYSDGSMTRRDEISLFKKQVGVVGYLASHGDDPVLEGYTHGLVVSGFSYDFPQLTSKGISVLAANSYPISCYSDALKNNNGKALTEQYKDDAELFQSGKTVSAAILDDVNKQAPLENKSGTARSSDWFIPASAQMFYILNGLYYANTEKTIDIESVSLLDVTSKTSNSLKVIDPKTSIFPSLEKLGEGHYIKASGYINFGSWSAFKTNSSVEFFNWEFREFDSVMRIYGSPSHVQTHPILAF